MESVSIVGFGHIGSAIATVLSEKSKIIYGIDNNKKHIENLNKLECPFEEPYFKKNLIKKIKEKKILCTNDFSYISKSDVIINTVGTPFENNKVNLSYLFSSMKKIAKHAKKNSLIIIKSTVPPRTTIEIYEKYFKRKKILLCFSPERIAEGNMIQEFKKLPIIIGGIDKKSSIAAEKFFKKHLKVKLIKTNNSTEAELVKLFDNLWIDLNIALGNEVGKVSKVLNVNALNVIKAANTLKKGSSYVNILTPSVGVGGYCLTKDPLFLNQFAKKMNVKIYTPITSRKINDSMPNYLKLLFEKKIKELKLKQIKALILGYSYKSNTGDTRFTPVEKFINLINKKKLLKQLDICDPLVSKEKILSRFSKNNFKNFSQVIKNKKKYDVIFFMNCHTLFKKKLSHIFNSLKQKGLIVDGRYYFTEKEIKKIKRKYNFLGVGW
jgi:nucleotide sugar dehydrogenase